MFLGSVLQMPRVLSARQKAFSSRRVFSGSVWKCLPTVDVNV